MKNKFLFVIFLMIFISFVGFSQDNSDSCKIPPEQGAPGGDTPDDNVSFSSGNTAQYSINSKCLIYMNGYFEQANSLLGGNYFEGSGSAEQLLEVAPIIIIPSGGLFGLENDSVFKAALQEYVRLGGTVIAFAQQYGLNIDNIIPIPDGQSLHSYGWREDQSCYWKKSYSVLDFLTLSAGPAIK